jgi:hypothetical protein
VEKRRKWSKDVPRAAVEVGYIEDDEVWRIFLDGPKEADVEELKDLNYYLCTSGGYSTARLQMRSEHLSLLK